MADSKFKEYHYAPPPLCTGFLADSSLRCISVASGSPGQINKQNCDNFAHDISSGSGVPSPGIQSLQIKRKDELQWVFSLWLASVIWIHFNTSTGARKQGTAASILFVKSQLQLFQLVLVRVQPNSRKRLSGKKDRRVSWPLFQDNLGKPAPEGLNQSGF